MATILIIDDDLEFCRIIQEALRRSGYEVLTAPDGARGLQAAANFTPDLIVCDLEMPVLTGYEVVSKLRTDERLEEIPFVFLSGCADRPQVRHGMNLGAD